ncbi:MAG: MFS transporter [Planctomycetaceae bacterium]
MSFAVCSNDIPAAAEPQQPAFEFRSAPSRMSTIEPAEPPRIPRDPGIYNGAFWLAFAGNLALTTANALTFRFAELVAFLQGTEKTAGAIVSAGVVGALAARIVLGQAIDRYGTRKSWLTATALFLSACVLFLLVRSLGWEIYAARTLFAVGLAGMFTCSMVHVQNKVPAHRRTEIIGALGTSGFLGMIAGSQLGDWIFAHVPEGRERFLILFGGAAALGVFYLGSVLVLTRKDEHSRPHETPAAHRLLFRYWPGYVLLVAIMLGFGITVITVFLTRFATEMGLSCIRNFFTAYSLSALIFRVPSTRWSRTIGRHRIILMGLAGNCLGHAMLPFVTSEWHFLPSAIACGFGHALLFPAVVSLGSGKFPREYRGSGTTIILGFTEIGAMISAPIFGWIIDEFGFRAMLWTSSITTLGVALLYACTAARRPDFDVDESPVLPQVEMTGALAATTGSNSLPAPAQTAGAGCLASGACLDK